jgi:hypothetical protein
VRNLLKNKYIAFLVLSAIILPFLVLGCPNGSAADGYTVKWEVTGAVTSGDPTKNPYSIVWTQENPDGGYYEFTAIGFEDRLPWTKEETLDAGTVVTLAISPNPDDVESTSFTFDFVLTIYVNGTAVATDDVEISVPPSYSAGDVPNPPLTVTVGG